MDAHPGGVLFYTDVYMENTLNIQNLLSFGSLSGSTWVEKAFVSGSIGNIGTNGTITAGGNLNGKLGPFTGTGKPTTPTALRRVYGFG